MAHDDVAVAVIGGGAAGIAAARRLHEARIDCLLVEARPRLGGRAWTVRTDDGLPLDLGCGWLHSADRNPWRGIAQAQGRTLDRTPPPWLRPSLPIGFPLDSQREFLAAMQRLYGRLALAAHRPDVSVASLLDRHESWNALLDAVSTFISGAELDQVSAHDLDCYDDSGTNWRAVDGYGTLVASHAAGVPTALGTEVRRIDHAGRRLRIETTRGTITADHAIVTLPSAVLAQKEELFAPVLPDKIDAARGLPLGLADKLFLALDHADEFPPDSRLFGHTDRARTAAYHMRPFGRPQIEVYFGGRLAADLESEGVRGFWDFAVSELTDLLGSAFARRIRPLHMHLWSADPFARGSYSYARPGCAADRARLAATVDDRIFFAGEACSKHDFSTAHGAFLTGVAAAETIIARLLPR